MAEPKPDVKTTHALPERHLPANIEAEQIVLGCVLLEPETAASVVQKLNTSSFFRPTHRVIFRTIQELLEHGKPADVVAVANRLEEKGEAENAGGRLYLNDLLDRVVTTTSLDYYVEIVQKKATLRALVEAGARISELGRDEAEGAETQLARAEEIVSKLSGNGKRGTGASTWATLENTVGPIQWAWPGWLPAGFLVLLAGDVGSGKSALALRIAASFIRGDDWPDGAPFRDETGTVLWCEAESAQAIHLARAKEWGLPLDRILAPFADPLADVRLDDPATVRRIRTMATEPEVCLVVVDSFSGSQRRNEKGVDAGWLSQSLATLARDSGKPVLAIHHLRKRTTEELPEVSLERVRGSTSIVQYARVVWGIDQPDLSQPDRRRLVQLKNNLRRLAPPIGLEIGGDGVQFCEAPARPHVDSQVDKAADLLLALLRVRPRPAVEIQREADGAGLSWETMKRAKKRLGIVAIRKDEAWLWSLPAGETCPF